MPNFESFELISLLLAGFVSLFAYPVASKRVVAFIFCVLFVISLVVIPPLYQWQYFTKPNRRDRAAQKAAVQSRVSQAGGWAVLEQECRAFIEASPRYHEEPNGIWLEVPAGYPALAALQPRKIIVAALEGGGGFVSMELFGMHSTGGRGIPYYHLVVPSRPVENIDSLGFERGRLNHITNLVYEAL